ncbi:MAG TPA: UPF0016 domain-containing protein [Ruminococcaceae bacterium]|nr:UPF0016 domain-containing protein [Oscillospiraceae bacterium]
MLLQTTWSYLLPFFTAIALITINELGDKSQLLTIAFATRMRLVKVLTGVLIASLANQGLAVAIGTLFASVPGWKNTVHLISSSLFILFGLLSLRPEREEKMEPKHGRFGDVATVALAFFFSEMGDKTQLATIALAARFPATPLLVWLGGAIGMLLADSLGVIAGHLLHGKLPDRLCKGISAIIFVLFGLSGIYECFVGFLHYSVWGAGIIVTIAGVFSLFAGLLLFHKSANPKHQPFSFQKTRKITHSSKDSMKTIRK